MKLQSFEYLTFASRSFELCRLSSKGFAVDKIFGSLNKERNILSLIASGMKQTDVGYLKMYNEGSTPRSS